MAIAHGFACSGAEPKCFTIFGRELLANPNQAAPLPRSVLLFAIVSRHTRQALIADAGSHLREMLYVWREARGMWHVGVWGAPGMRERHRVYSLYLYIALWGGAMQLPVAPFCTCTTGAQHRTLEERPILSRYRSQF